VTEPPHRRRLVLASASPARRRLLVDAGFAPHVVVSGVDESAHTAADTPTLVTVLARAKAGAVAAGLADALVVGCDSLLDVDGEAQGKPASAEEAVRRWRRLGGRSADLVTGHALLDVRGGRVVAERVAAESTRVRFARPSEAEIAAYVATGEPLHVAGAFTLDGRGSVFVEGVDGSPSNVIGLSLPLLRRMLLELGVEPADLWTREDQS
jgi:septum formation protein